MRTGLLAAASAVALLAVTACGSDRKETTVIVPPDSNTTVVAPSSGQSVTTNPDGSTVVTNPDGSQVVVPAQ